MLSDYKAIHAAIADLDVQFDNDWSIGPYAVIEYHFVGEQRRAIGFVPPGKAGGVKLFRVDVAEMREGKIARIQRYANPIQVLAFTDETLK